MPNILELLGGINPEQNRGLLAAAAQILQRSGPSRQPFSIGQAMGTGMEAYQGSMDEQRARALAEQQMQQAMQMRDLQFEDGQLDLESKKRARQQQEQMDAAARGSVRSAGQQAAALPGGPTVANAERIGEFQDGFDMDGFINQMMQINPMKAMELRQSMKKAGPKFDAGITWVNGPDGKPMAVRTADDGSFKQLDGMAPREKLHFLNTGGKTLGVGEYSGEQAASFTNTVDPGDLLSAATQRRGQDITARGQNMVDARARQLLAHQQQFAKAPTEFQGKSAAFGLRATEADKILSGLTGKYDPAAVNSKTSVEGWPLVGGALGAAVNKFAMGANDQKAEQAQRDFINAVLRQESGAAIGDSEFDNARKQYFPQPGDGPAVVAQKARARQLSIQGLQSNAGRAAMRAPAATSDTPGDITDLLNKYGGN